MTKLFASLLFAASLTATSAWAGSSGEFRGDVNPNVSRAIMVAALVGQNDAVLSHAAFVRRDDPQSAKAALLTFLVLLSAQGIAEQQKR